MSRAMFERGSFGIQVKSLMELSYWTLLQYDKVLIQLAYTAALPFESNGASHA